MTATEIINQLTRCGVQMIPVGDKIRFRFDKAEPPPEELVTAAKEHKREIMAELKTRSSNQPLLANLTETEREAYQELLEVMTSPKFGMAQGDAEKEAMKIINRNSKILQVQQASKEIWRIRTGLKLSACSIRRLVHKYGVRDAPNN